MTRLLDGSCEVDRQDHPPAASETLWLLGQPHLRDYLDFVETSTVGGAQADRRALTDEWRAANDLYYDLEANEAGAADGAGCLPLPSEMAALAAAVRENRYYRASFDELPTDIHMVELDRLIVSQLHIERTLGEGLVHRPDSSMSPEALLQFCLPTDPQLPPVHIEKFGSDRYVFSSPSTDFRPRPALLLRPEQLSGITASGPIVAMVGTPVGFGCNFMMAVRSGSRLVLQNGYHRAYALRAAGYTHAPCVVQEVTRKDELRIAATDRVAADPEFYFAAKRPPLLRDFFDPRLVRRLPTLPIRTVVEVEFRVRMTSLTAVD